MYHDFVGVHQTLKTTPVLALGIDNHRWRIEEMVELLPILAYNTRPQKSGGFD